MYSAFAGGRDPAPFILLVPTFHSRVTIGRVIDNLCWALLWNPCRIMKNKHILFPLAPNFGFEIGTYRVAGISHRRPSSFRVAAVLSSPVWNRFSCRCSQPSDRLFESVRKTIWTITRCHLLVTISTQHSLKRNRNECYLIQVIL